MHFIAVRNDSRLFSNVIIITNAVEAVVDNRFDDDIVFLEDSLGLAAFKRNAVLRAYSALELNVVKIILVDQRIASLDSCAGVFLSLSIRLNSSQTLSE